MPQVAQGDIFSFAGSVDLLIVFGHRGHGGIDVAWSKFRERFPGVDTMGEPFTSPSAEPYEYAPGRFIATVAEERNHGMGDNKLHRVLESYLGWAKKKGLRRTASNGIMNTDHAGDTTENRASDDRRARMLIELAKSYEDQFQVKITLTNMNDVFVRQYPSSRRRASGNSTTNHSSGVSMTNHQKLLQTIKADKKLAGTTFTFTQVYGLANKTLQETTLTGISYAVLKFLQIYCTCTNEELSRDFFLPRTDPRKFKNLPFIKSDARFKLKADDAKKPTANSIPLTKGNIEKVIEDQIEALVKSWRKRDIEEGSWEPWAPFDDEWIIESDRIAPHPEIDKERGQKSSCFDEFRPTKKCLSILQVIWNGKPREGTHASKGKKHWHCYGIKAVNQPFWEKWRDHDDYDETQPDLWWCKSVENAGKRWSWSDSREGPFATIALALQTAVKQRNDVRTAAICLIVLKWGGVESKNTKFYNWIISKAAAGTLCAALIDATCRLIPQSSLPVNVFDRHHFFMDSSSTKVYAALALNLSSGVGVGQAKQDVLIYDGRVAGALGLITRYVLSDLGQPGIPADLKFPVEPDRPSSEHPERNPSCPPYGFPYLAHTSPGDKERAQFARIAARWIQVVIGATGPSPDFITAEQGLFMIGYNVRERCDATPRCPPPPK